MLEEFDTHALLKFPLAAQICESSCFDQDLWNGKFRSLADCVEAIGKCLEAEVLCDFVAVL